jgi:flagellar biosynthesis GTPase FlhF
MSEVRITVIDQLNQLEDIVLYGSRIPFSGVRLVNEKFAFDVMDALRESLPSQITHADELIRQRDSFVEKARQQAAQTEQELQARMAQLEQQFAVRRQQLEQEAQTRRQQLEGEAAERNRVLVEQHERGRQQAMQELETIRQEGLRVQRDSQVEAERLHNDALQFRQQTQQQCDALIARSRQEAATIAEGANRYAEQVLGELEGRLKELSQVVLGGRRELVRMQNPETATNGAVVPLPEAANGLPQAEPMNRARRAAGRLRRATRGLAS